MLKLHFQWKYTKILEVKDVTDQLDNTKNLLKLIHEEFENNPEISRENRFNEKFKTFREKFILIDKKVNQH